jgi:hypothetical protein
MAAAERAKRQKILELIERKEMSQLEETSLEELRAMLD